MQKNTEDQELENALQTVIESIQEQKGEEIVDLDLTALNTSFCRHFVICHVQSTTHVKAVAKTLEEKMFQKHKIKPFHKEGLENAQWVLLDFTDIIVHIFQEPSRRFYHLEDLWADGEKRIIGK